jgi:hypothetical protein
MTTNDEQSQPQKRPASHRWALFGFIVMAGGQLMLNAKGHFDTLGVIATAAALAGIIGFLFFPRSTRTYAVGMVALGLVLLRGGQSTYYHVQAQLRGEGQGWIYVVGIGWILVLLMVLFREYYGLPSTPSPIQESNNQSQGIPCHHHSKRSFHNCARFSKSTPAGLPWATIRRSITAWRGRPVRRL